MPYDARLPRNQTGSPFRVKFLAAIVTAQLLLTLALLVVILDPQSRGEARDETLPSGQAPAGDSGQPSSDGSKPEPVGEVQLRRIIREEILALFDSMPAAVDADEPEAAPRVSPEEYRQRLELAHQELEFYIERGEISNVEMAELQAKIARLDPESRRHMLSLLARALNSGALDGQF